MGAFYVSIDVVATDGKSSEEVQALADTGAAWTWLPKEILERLGYKPTLKRRLQTADKRVIVRDAVQAHVRIGEETLTTLCIFGDAGSIPLLGATTMQEFSLAPDPVKEELVPTVGVLATLLDE
jgi:clan AA aspartic protease